MNKIKKPKFKEGDRVLAGDRGANYEAKILKCEGLDDIFKYFIHYQGWDRKHDCWLDESQIESMDGPIIKKSKSNVQVESKVEKQESSESTQSFKKKRTELASLNLIEDEEETKFKLKFNIPCDFKKHLVDEWVIISQETNKRLLKLPCSNTCTVKAIIDSFLEEKKNKLDKLQFKSLKELMSGLLKYFDDSLPRILLYRQERAQYDSLQKSHGSLVPSAIYGGEHLLRLFVRLPRMLQLVYLPSADIQNIHTRLSELIKFLHKHSTEYVNIHHYVAEEESLSVTHSSSSSTKKTK